MASSSRIASVLIMVMATCVLIPEAQAKICLSNDKLEQIIRDFARSPAAGAKGWLEVREGDRCERPLSKTAILAAPRLRAFFFDGEDPSMRTPAEADRARSAEKAILVTQGVATHSGTVELTLVDRDALFIDPANPMKTFVFRLHTTWVDNAVAVAWSDDASTSPTARCVSTIQFYTEHDSDRAGGSGADLTHLDLQPYRITLTDVEGWHSNGEPKKIEARVIEDPAGYRRRGGAPGKAGGALPGRPLKPKEKLTWSPGQDRQNPILWTEYGELNFYYRRVAGKGREKRLGEFVWSIPTEDKLRFSFEIARIDAGQARPTPKLRTDKQRAIDLGRRRLQMRPRPITVSNDCRPPPPACPNPDEVFGYFVGRVRAGFPFVGLGLAYEWRHPKFTWSIGGQVDLDLDLALEITTPAPETPAHYITAASLEWRAGPTLMDIDVLAGIAFGVGVGDPGSDPYFSPRLVLAPTRLPITLGLGVSSVLDHEAPVRKLAFVEWEHTW